MTLTAQSNHMVKAKIYIFFFFYCLFIDISRVIVSNKAQEGRPLLRPGDSQYHWQERLKGNGTVPCLLASPLLDCVSHSATKGFYDIGTILEF